MPSGSLERKYQQYVGESALGPSLAAASKALETFNAREPFETLLERHIPGLSMDHVSCDLSAEDWNVGSVVIRHLRQLGATDIDMTPWIRVGAVADVAGLDVGGVSKLELRELRMRTSVPPVPMCPKSTRVTATICLVSSEGSGPSLTFMTSKTSHDVPFGERFLVQEKVELAPRGDLGVDLKISGRVAFLKSCGVFQSRIHTNIMSELGVAAEALALQFSSVAPVSLARREDNDSPDKDLLMDENTRTEIVWELQRRATLWSNVWYAPFLPHDGLKRWRWVSPDYKPHEQCLAFAKKSAMCDTPPVGPPPGWRQVADWQPECSPKTTSDGWQYAVDFYGADQLWCKSPFALHVRRRRWVCSYQRLGAS